MMTATTLLPLPEDYTAFDKALVKWLREGDATYKSDRWNLNLFERIRLAHCAMERACENCIDAERFTSEYKTVRLYWDAR